MERPAILVGGHLDSVWGTSGERPQTAPPGQRPSLRQPRVAAWGTTHRPGTRAAEGATAPDSPPRSEASPEPPCPEWPSLWGLRGSRQTPPQPDKHPVKGGEGWNRSRKSLRILSPGPSCQVGGFPSGGEALSRRPSASVPPAGAQTPFSQHCCDPSSPRLPTPSSCLPSSPGSSLPLPPPPHSPIPVPGRGEPWRCSPSLASPTSQPCRCPLHINCNFVRRVTCWFNKSLVIVIIYWLP